MHTWLITVEGKVQGVFYRQSAKEKALELGITGTVSNVGERTVSIKATGNAEQLNKLLEWCNQGPPRAIVKSVSHKEIPLENFSRFETSR